MKINNLFNKTRNVALASAGAIALMITGCVNNDARPKWLDGIQIGDTSNVSFFTNHESAPDNGILFDVGARSDELRMFRSRSRGKAGEAVCPAAPDSETIATLSSKSLNAWRGAASGTLDGRNFSRQINASAMRMLVDHDGERATRDIDLLVKHAIAKAWIHPNPRWSSYTSVSSALPTLIPAWRILRQTGQADETSRAMVDNWMRDLILFADKHPEVNAGTAARAASFIQIGAMLEDQSMVARGDVLYDAFLETMLEDGSFPTETNRGKDALAAHTRALGAMVLAAETAADGGRDLYGHTNSRGNSLADAVRFLLAADKDNSLVDRYAKANIKGGGPDAFVPDNQDNAFSGSGGAWVALFSRRFAGTPEADALKKRAGLGRRIFGDTAGGWVSCFSGRV